MKWLNRIGIWKKQIFSFLIVMLIPATICLVLAGSLRSIIMDNEKKRALNSLDKTMLMLQEILNATQAAALSIACDGNVLALLTSTYPDNFSQISAYWQNGDLSTVIKSNTRNIDNIILYSERENLFSTGYIQKTPDEIKNTDWYQKALDKRNSSFWAMIDNVKFNNTTENNLSLVSPIYSANEVAGVLVVFVNQQQLNNVMLYENFDIVFSDPNDRVVVASNPGRTSDALDSSAGQGKNVLTKTMKIPNTTGAFSLTAVLTNNEIFQETRDVIGTAVKSILLGFIASFILIFILSKILTYRLIEVSSQIKKVADGDLNYEPPVDGTDEIAVLSRNLGGMIKKINLLMEDNYTIRMKKERLENYQKDMQLQILSSQLNPHFLFNSMESIRMKALAVSDTQAAQAIQKLSQLLRQSLHIGTQPILLKDEVKFAQNYLDLQKLRFGDKLNYEIDCNIDMEEQTVLPFILQPIVENAILHGLEESLRPGFVAIQIELESGDLIIRVADNGSGIEPDILEQLTQALEGTDESFFEQHIGVLNVHKRLKYHYGDEYGIKLNSLYGKGTVVTIKIPSIQ